MTYRGKVKNGQIILDEPVKLPDGAEVRIEISPSAEEIAALRNGLKRLAGIAQGLPDDMAEQHDHYIHGTPHK